MTRSPMPRNYWKSGGKSARCPLTSESGHEESGEAHRFPLPPCFAKGVEKRLGWLAMTGEENVTMSGKATAFVVGVLLASMIWIVLAQQSYCTGGLADWLKMGDVVECR